MNEKIKDGLHLHTEWYENGKKKKEGTYKNGVKDGLWIEWYDNGHKYMERSYNKYGKWDGLWTSWYVSGLKYSEGTYNNGRKEGLWTWWYNVNGRKQCEITYKDDVQDGLYQIVFRTPKTNSLIKTDDTEIKFEIDFSKFK